MHIIHKIYNKPRALRYVDTHTDKIKFKSCRQNLVLDSRMVISLT